MFSNVSSTHIYCVAALDSRHQQQADMFLWNSSFFFFFYSVLYIAIRVEKSPWSSWLWVPVRSIIYLQIDPHAVRSAYINTLW